MKYYIVVFNRALKSNKSLPAIRGPVSDIFVRLRTLISCPSFFSGLIILLLSPGWVLSAGFDEVPPSVVGYYNQWSGGGILHDDPNVPCGMTAASLNGNPTRYYDYTNPRGGKNQAMVSCVFMTLWRVKDRATQKEPLFLIGSSKAGFQKKNAALRAISDMARVFVPLIPQHGAKINVMQMVLVIQYSSAEE